MTFLIIFVLIKANRCEAHNVCVNFDLTPSSADMNKNGGSGWIRTTDLTLIRGAL